MPLFNSEWGALSRPLMHDSEVDYDLDVHIEPEERPVMSIFGDIMVWLHKQVMIKLAANGGRVPEELKH